MKSIWFKMALVICIAVSTTTCKDQKQEKILTQEVTFKKEGELTIFRKDSILTSLDIEIADNDYETRTGLMYRKSMPDNDAMLFIFPDELMRSFYMKNTEFPLDIIYIGSDKRIVSIQRNAKPRDEASLPSEKPAMYVLEVNGGLTSQWGLQKGDRIEWTPIK